MTLSSSGRGVARAQGAFESIVVCDCEMSQPSRSRRADDMFWL